MTSSPDSGGPAAGPSGAPLDGARERVPRLRLAAMSLGVAAVACVAIALVAYPELSRRPALPDLGRAPDFELVDQAGRTVATEDLVGRPWVASFVFTRCPTICPTLTRHVGEIARETHRDVPTAAYVSFSVDPAHDRPEVLRAYAARHEARAAAGEFEDGRPRWLFLTTPGGDVETMLDVVVSGFRVAMENSGPDAAPEEVVHGPHVAVVDAAGRVRAWHDTTRPESVDLVARDLRAVAAEPAPAPSAAPAPVPAS